MEAAKFIREKRVGSLIVEDGGKLKEIISSQRLMSDR
jgi:hypothetical protein